LKRRVIKQANQAYTITLPIDWVRKNRLTSKSEVDVNPAEKALIISTGNMTAGGTASFDATGMTRRTVYLHISALYAKGIDEIHVTSKTDINALLVSAIHQSLGYAIVDQKGHSYTIKDVSGVNGQEIDEVFKRVFQMTLLFYEAAINDLSGKREETPEELKARDAEVNKFTLYLQRAINKMSYPDSVKGRMMFTYSFMLEKIGDEVERLWRHCMTHKVRIDGETKKLMQLSHQALSMAFHLHYRFDFRKMQELYELRDRIREKARGLDTNISRYIINIADQATDLNHLTLMKTL
jgi:phosphate uptake regulator